MLLIYLKNKLTSYEISNLNYCPYLVRGLEEPAFCIISKKWHFKKVNQRTNTIWIFPNPLPWSKKIISQMPCPIYFSKKERDGSYLVYDRRYLETKRGLYELPPLQVDLSKYFFKDRRIRELELQLFGFQKNTNFYFKGDILDRLSTPSYLKALLDRQTQPHKLHTTSIYLSIKKIIDK